MSVSAVVNSSKKAEDYRYEGMVCNFKYYLKKMIDSLDKDVNSERAKKYHKRASKLEAKIIAYDLKKNNKKNDSIKNVSNMINLN
jgi:hypothetical protein